MIPIYGSYQDIREAIDNPTPMNIGMAGLSILSEIPLLKWLKFGKALKTAKRARKALEANHKEYDRLSHTLQRMQDTPGINPKKIRTVNNRRGKLYREQFDLTKENNAAQKALKEYKFTPLDILSTEFDGLLNYAQTLTQKYK